MSRKKPRARSERRELERGMRRAVRGRERDAARLPGGAPTQPLVVSSASLIETRALAQRCPQCGGELSLVRHQAQPGAPALRRVDLLCRLCHVPRSCWFRIEAGGPN